jgi:mannosyltransferase
MARFRALTLTAFGALIAFGCFLRFWKLTDVGLWYDELWTVVGASDRPFMEMYREWILGDSHPPGFFLFYFAWFKIVPNTEFWARIPSAIVGVITVMYLLFRTQRVLTRDERIMSASFASLSYIYIFYALSVKQYSAMILFATVATVSYLEIVTARRVDRRTGITLATACLALAHLNHFAMVYAWILIALLALTFRHNREAVRRIVRIGIAFGLGYLPIAYFLYVQVRYSIDAWQPYEIQSFLSDLLPSLFFDDPAFVKCALGILFGFLLVSAVTRQQARHMLAANRNRHIVLIVVAFAGFMLALGMAEPIFFVRYFLVILPALFLGLGILAAAAFPIEKGWLAILPLAFFFSAAVVQFRSIDGMQRQQWDKSVDFVLASKKPDESIFVLGAKMNETEFGYVTEGDVDGVFYVRNLKFYEYYFRRRGAYDMAAKLEVVQPTVESVLELAARFHGTGTTIYVLAGHHIQYSGNALATLEQVTRQMEVTPMFSTLVYRLIF